MSFLSQLAWATVEKAADFCIDRTHIPMCAACNSFTLAQTNSSKKEIYQLLRKDWLIEGASLPPAGDTQYGPEAFGNLVPTTFHAYISKRRAHMWDVQEGCVGHVASSICSITCLSICLLLMTVSRALPFSYIILSFCNPSLCIYLFICHLTSYSLISKIIFI